MAIGSVVTVPRLEDQFRGDGGSRVAWATRRQGLLPAGKSTPKEGSKRRGDPGHALVHLAGRVFVPGVAVPMVLHPGDRRHARPTHLSGRMARRAAMEFWFQDPLAAVSAGLDHSIQTRERAPPQRPPRPRPSRSTGSAGFPRSQKSWSPEVREVYRGLPAGEWPSLGLRLLRKRQPPGVEPQPSSAQRLPSLRKANTSSRDAPPGNAARLELSRQAARRTSSSDTNPVGRTEFRFRIG